MGTTPQPEAWEQVSAVLESPEWNFVTIDGLAKKTHLSPEVIQTCLLEHETDVRQALLRDPKGQALYTSRSRRKSLREFFAEMQAFARNSF